MNCGAEFDSTREAFGSRPPAQGDFMSVGDWLFNPAASAGRANTLFGRPVTVALHTGADAVTGLALLAIAMALIVFFTNRFRLRRIGYVFASLVAASALTHFVAIYTLGSPLFGIELLVRLTTAAIAAGTAVALWVLLPRVLTAPSAGHLAGLNTELAATVETRTAELLAANEGLERLIADNAMAHQKLARSEAQYRVSFEGAMVGKVQSDPLTGFILRANPAFAAMLGYEPNEIVGQIGWELTWPEDRADDQAAFARVTSGELSAYVREKRFRRRDGTPVWARVSANVVRVPGSGEPDITVAVVENIDERRKAEAALEITRSELEDMVVERTAALVQRNLLLREVYHRVKNNLQLVDSILVMQGRRLSDPEAKTELAGLRTRIYALGLVHQQLMGSANLQTFDVAPFLQELTGNILDGGASTSISINVNAEPLDVGLDFAIPLGLLVTELVTNSLKHAFPGGKGHIDVALSRNDDGTFALVISDDGTGYDSGASPQSDLAGGLGSKIITALVNQLKATMTIQSEHGTRTDIQIAAAA